MNALTPHQERTGKAAWDNYQDNWVQRVEWSRLPRREKDRWVRVAQAVIKAHETETPDQCHFPSDDGSEGKDRS